MFIVDLVCELQWLFSFFGSGIILRLPVHKGGHYVQYNTLQRAMRIALVTSACTTTKVWFQEKANAFVIFSWNLLQNMFSGIFSSSTLPPVTQYSIQYADCMWRENGWGWVVLEAIFCRILHCVCDQIKNYKTGCPPLDKNLGVEGAPNRETAAAKSFRPERFCTVLLSLSLIHRGLNTKRITIVFFFGPTKYLPSYDWASPNRRCKC